MYEKENDDPPSPKKCDGFMVGKTPSPMEAFNVAFATNIVVIHVGSAVGFEASVGTGTGEKWEVGLGTGPSV